MLKIKNRHFIKNNIFYKNINNPQSKITDYFHEIPGEKFAVINSKRIRNAIIELKKNALFDENSQKRDDSLNETISYLNKDDNNKDKANYRKEKSKKFNKEIDNLLGQFKFGRKQKFK